MDDSDDSNQRGGLEEMNPEEQKSVPAGSEAQPFVIPSELFEQRGRTFSVINQKGGCGKTTTTMNSSLKP